MISIEPISIAVSKLELFFDDQPLSNATGFFWRSGAVTYLVTNWHVLSGRDALTGVCLDTRTAAVPNCIKIDILSGLLGDQRSSARVQLLDDDGPIWVEHPRFGRQVDVAMLALPDGVARCVYPINDRLTGNYHVQVAEDVFVIGYPLAIDVERLPIWKRASVASEPDIDAEGQPKLYVDTASTSGMSGSPVIHRATKGVTESGELVIAGPLESRLLGVYSGRVSRGGSLDAQLGIVWKSRVIPEIIGGDKRATA